MMRALALARRGLYSTDPNPRVGCVIAHGERVVGEGWHRYAGEPHAEIHALAAAGGGAAGATAYVTLEPCRHTGRTGPCTRALVEARVARVVAAMRDPDPRVAGRGFAELAAAGVEVETGLLEAEAGRLNRGFVSRYERGRPWVRCKLAATLDGRTATATGESRWITGEAARADVHRLRARAGAVLTGIGTLLADDPRLDARVEDAGCLAPPMRVIADSRLRTPPAARVFSAPGRVLVATSRDASGAGAPRCRGGNRLASGRRWPGCAGRPHDRARRTRASTRSTPNAARPWPVRCSSRVWWTRSWCIWRRRCSATRRGGCSRCRWSRRCAIGSDSRSPAWTRVGADLRIDALRLLEVPGPASEAGGAPVTVSQ